jgi:hypothetical protein
VLEAERVGVGSLCVKTSDRLSSCNVSSSDIHKSMYWSLGVYGTAAAEWACVATGGCCELSGVVHVRAGRGLVVYAWVSSG